MANVQSVLELTRAVSSVANDKITKIIGITRRSRMLALNATIEAHRAGDAGRGFAVVAEEVKGISSEIAELTNSLQNELQGKLVELDQAGHAMMARLESVGGERLVDLAHNMIEIIDRNLYERSCDVRWWATDSAVVDAAAEPNDERCRFASHRLGVILDSYTVYLDLWIADRDGRVIASGRPGSFATIGLSVADQDWFRKGLATRNGGDFTVADIQINPHLGNRPVATYATAIRAGGRDDGEPIGVLGIFFDWGPQADAVVNGVRLSPEEKAQTRALLLDSKFNLLASSDGRGVLSERIPLETHGRTSGHYAHGEQTVAFALTPGYETYRGLGWYGVLIQS